MADTQQTNESEEGPNFTLFSRILSYPIVHYATDTATGYYDYVKSYNDYSKRVLETAESYALPIVSASLTKIDEYSHKPIIEGIVIRADTYGNQQLDKIEEGIQKVKEAAPKAIKTVEGAIHGSRVETVLIKTVGILDNVVETLLPPPQKEKDGDHTDGEKSEEEEQELERSKHENGGKNEHTNEGKRRRRRGHNRKHNKNTENEHNDELVDNNNNHDHQETDKTHETDESSDTEPTIVTVTGPVLNKIRARVSKKSVLRLPFQTYSGLKELALRNTENLPLPHLVKQYANFLNSASSYILATKEATESSLHKGAELSKVSADYVYTSLQGVVSSVNSLLAVVKRLDPIEARATVAELSSMIATSKQNVTHILDNRTQKLKEDSSAILSRAGDVLSRPFEAGYTLVANSDIQAIKTAFNSLESAVQGIVESFSIQAEQTSE